MSETPLTPAGSAAISSTAASSSGSLPRPAPRRTPSIPSNTDPLSAPSTSPTVPYATYSSHKRKTSLPGLAPTILAASAQDVPSPSPSTANPSPSLPPTSPSAAPAPPPLLSRLSEASVPKGIPATRPYARSVSDATRALLGQHLKADLQALGLTAEAAGAGMVQVLAGIANSGEEWKNIKAAVESGKVTLLLPKELVAGVLTPAFVADHLALITDAPHPHPHSASPRPLVTLTGLRGTMTDSQLVISSCGNALVESAVGLLKPGSLSPADFTDESVHRALRGEAHTLPPPSLPTPHPYPAFNLESEVTLLSIPKASTRSVSGSGTPKPSTSSRLAALFAKTPYDSDPLSATGSPSPSPAPDVPFSVAAGGASSSSGTTTPPNGEGAAGSPSRAPNLQVPVLVVNKAIRHAEMIRLVGKALDAHLRSVLNRVPGCDDVILERVCAFAQRLQPPPSWKGVVPPPNPAMGDSLFAASVDDISDEYQDLAHLARGELQKALTASGLAADEEQVDAGVEQIEELLTSQLYDRLFSPFSSGDAAEDEALLERMSELRDELEFHHLGMDLDALGEEEQFVADALETISDEVGAKLGGLSRPECRSPSAKMDVFVEVHRVIVDGLSVLPPIPLKKETRSSSSAGDLSRAQSHEVEMTDAPTSSRAPSVHITIPETRPVADNNSDDDTMKTPRPVSVLGREEEVPELGATSSVTLSDASSAPAFKKRPTSSSADLILPVLIYSLVQACPPTLASELKFVHRFRAQDLFRGEGAYCATGISAAVEFLIHVEGAELGLRLLSPSRSLPSSSASSIVGVESSAVGGGRLKLRASNVSQELDAFVDSANHRLAGLAGGGFDLFFGENGVAPRTVAEFKNALDGASIVARTARGGLRRATSSIAPSTAAENALSPTISRTANSVSPQREMVDFVPTPQSEVDQPDLYAQPETAAPAADEDVRSVRSFSSLLREPLVGRSRTASVASGEERSIGDRIASIGSRASIFSAFAPRSPTPNSAAAPAAGPKRPTSIAPSDLSALSLAELEPNQRFLDCEAGELRVGEVADLLEEYRKVVRVLVAAKEGLVGPAAGLGLGN